MSITNIVTNVVADGTLYTVVSMPITTAWLGGFLLAIVLAGIMLGTGTDLLMEEGPKPYLIRLFFLAVALGLTVKFMSSLPLPVVSAQDAEVAPFDQPARTAPPKPPVVTIEPDGVESLQVTPLALAPVGRVRT